MRRTIHAALLGGCIVLLAACGEKPQAAGTKKVDAAPWEGTQSAAYADKAWKPGDQASWETQIRTRAQGQDEYRRMAPGHR